jgi:hypothetical protein
MEYWRASRSSSPILPPFLYSNIPVLGASCFEFRTCTFRGISPSVVLYLPSLSLASNQSRHTNASLYPRHRVRVASFRKNHRAILFRHSTRCSSGWRQRPSVDFFDCSQGFPSTLARRESSCRQTKGVMRRDSAPPAVAEYRRRGHSTF